MPEMIAYCGLDCSKCEAYQLTLSNDLEGQNSLLARWRMEYNAPSMDLASVTCDGCTSAGRLGGYCPQCPVRACNQGRGLPHCAACPDYICERLADLFLMAPQMRENLEKLRS
jgi:hypothetical protein